MSRFARRLWLVPLIIYLLISLYQINLPGLHYDEAFEAVPALQMLQGQPVTTFRNHGLSVAGHTFPLMTQDYIGAINTYLSIPFIALLGATPAALRAMTILLGAITLWLTYALTVRFTKTYWVGLAAMLILTADPTFVFWNRQGIFVTSVTATIGLAATLCWLLYFQKRSIRWAVAGAFLFGLGLYAKFLFLWLIAAIIGAAILVNLPEITRIYQQKNLEQLFLPSLNQSILIFLAFLAGCLPLIIYNVQTNGTYLSIVENAGTSYYGVDNLAFGSNLAARVSQFGVMLNGSHLWYLGVIQGISLPSFIFVGLFVIVVIMTTRNFVFRLNSSEKSTSFVKVALFPYLVITLVILASIGTVSALWVTHFALLMPWPAVALALTGWLLLKSFPRRTTATTLVVILLLLVGNHVLNTFRYHQALGKSGGLSTHSDAIYDLSDWLAANADGPVAAMDWGLAAPITFLTAGHVVPVEVFGYAWGSNQELAKRLEGLIAQPATLYLWRAPEEIIFDRSGEFKALYQPLSLEENIEEAFYERSGRPLLGVTRLVELGTADNAPK
jgi:4-amino-4-deoxy-L-arabinose transferase-like glycosyltransferase